MTTMAHRCARADGRGRRRAAWGCRRRRGRFDGEDGDGDVDVSRGWGERRSATSAACAFVAPRRRSSPSSRDSRGGRRGRFETRTGDSRECCSIMGTLMIDTRWRGGGIECGDD